MRWDLILFWVIVAALDCADLPVIGGSRIGGSQWEGRLERCGGSLPLDESVDLDPIATIAGRNIEAFMVESSLLRRRCNKRDNERALSSYQSVASGYASVAVTSSEHVHF